MKIFKHFDFPNFIFKISLVDCLIGVRVITLIEEKGDYTNGQLI